MGSEKRRDVKVVYTGGCVYVVGRGSLAQGYPDDATGVKPGPFRVLPKKGKPILPREFEEAAEVLWFNRFEREQRGIAIFHVSRV